MQKAAIQAFGQGAPEIATPASSRDLGWVANGRPIIAAISRRATLVLCALAVIAILVIVPVLGGNRGGGELAGPQATLTAAAGRVSFKLTSLGAHRDRVGPDNTVNWTAQVTSGELVNPQISYQSIAIIGPTDPAALYTSHNLGATCPQQSATSVEACTGTVGQGGTFGQWVSYLPVGGPMEIVINGLVLTTYTDPVTQPAGVPGGGVAEHVADSRRTQVPPESALAPATLG